MTHEPPLTPRSLPRSIRAVVWRAARIALVVGTILTLINQGGALVHGPYDTVFAGRMFLNFLVPFLVATYSASRGSVGAGR